MAGVATSGRVRTRARVHGTVQGVGFRPFVYRLAREEGLAGYVLNDEHGVVVEVEGDLDAADAFMVRLRREAPPLARVDEVECEQVPARGEAGFRIVESVHGGTPNAPVTADSATCDECLAELLDPANRRYRYPFINCTNCGPRFSIVRGVPYDRPLTTMAAFAMCAACRREYDDPSDRRFHAQPNACPECGPHVRLIDSGGAGVVVPGARDAIDGAARRLADGLIVAVKGVGGFHLACRADDQAAVELLRARKHREDKPFALMVADVDAALHLVRLEDDGRQLLAGVQRPIVLAPRRPRAPVAPAVAPLAPELGVMLAYSPLHHLLLGDFAAAGGGAGALVMTSGNVSDEPIAYRDDDALERLGAIADLLLVHDREIHARTDDSVVRVVTAGPHRRPLTLRRSRGYVPDSVPLAHAATRHVLACGAEQKNTFCVAKGSRAWVSHHIGDLEHYPAYVAFVEGIEHFERLFAVTPEVVAHDLHPDYLSTSYALERAGVEHLGVQHHHAHLAACLAEHGIWTGSAVGAIFDGTGYGLDGTIWGGELLVGGLIDFERAARLWAVPLPGGAAAIREPWRMAFAWLAEATGQPPSLPSRLDREVDPEKWRAIGQVLRRPEHSLPTTSMGRLFDAIGTLCGLGVGASYEGQAAVELEAAATRSRDRRRYDWQLLRDDPDSPCMLVLDPREAVRSAARDLESGESVANVAARFHAGAAAAAADAVTAVASEYGLERAVLSGGVFQNRLLLEAVAGALMQVGLEVLIPERLPPNDGGISLGQAAVATARTGALVS